MRKVTEQIIRAFESGKNLRVSNSEVKADATGVYMYLFGNLIAKKENNKLFITMAGYNTVTTRERLNGIKGVSLCQRNYTPYLNGKEIDSCEWYEVGQV